MADVFNPFQTFYKQNPDNTNPFVAKASLLFFYNSFHSFVYEVIMVSVETSVQIAFHVDEQLVLVHLLLIFNVISCYSYHHNRLLKKRLFRHSAEKKEFVQNLLHEAVNFNHKYHV